ncbi:hypothetical protein [Pontibacter sp. SGAir0037]|uniref:hypothetical protein n=1 Tax=Pontibacter sp. SGAir0037 TaxID=2571030 RepID=UPI0010CD3BD6|nr:hypothetical protein [Pontibacter sp. SGAir0037]QCR22349.1 hypothetical protein C1N53_08365 [Pontibacter sp. SGAir0037]
MKYLEWNNIISSYFFNPANAGKDIYLYLTKNDIINIARQHFDIETEDEIWADFINAIKRGVPGSNGNIIAKAKFAHSKHKLVGIKKADGTFATIDGIPVLFPPHISYLTFMVLPLVENVDNANLRPNNYYGRLNSFLQSHQINENIGTTDFSDNQINCLWEDLSKWANIIKNGELGLFNVIPFSNANWIYVGKVFSQCVLPPKLLNRLPELFESIGLVPNTFYDEKFLQEKVKNSRTDLIPKSTLEFLKKDDELSKSIIQTIQRLYKKWSGETHIEIEEGTATRKKRNYTVAPLFLQFKVNTNDEVILFSYRMYSSNDYPEDLKFENYENLYEINGWSKTLPLGFYEALELEDNFNKWIAKFPNRDIRLFVSAGRFKLSNDFWIETDLLSKTEQMYLLCKSDKQELIKEWGKTFGNGNFKQEDFEGLPDNYSLFWFRSPTQGLTDISILTLYTEKRIELVGGLKVNFRTYINDFLPEVEIVNSDGNENVYLQYKDTDEKIYLSKKTSLNNRWLLPEKTAINTDFYIKVEDETFSGNALAYNLVSSNSTAIKVDGLNLQKRDSFGRNIIKDAEQFCLGSNIVNSNKSSQRYFSTYGPLFTSIFLDTQTNIINATFNNHNGNNFCNFLTLKSELSTEDFFKAFEFFYSEEFSEHQANTNYNLTKLKRASLNFYDYIGILDYDYETKNIILNPPQFIFIPADKGRKILLIGARDTALIEKIITAASKHKLQVEITKQFLSNEILLLPDVITIKAFQQANDSYGENNIIAFVNELNIKFTSKYFPQIALQDFSSNINDYENTLEEIDENDYDWARYIFNAETLVFDKSETLSFDRSFCLLKYKLNEYTYYFKLWKDNKCYKVDVNWGKFLALKYFSKDVILFDSVSNKVAIPIETPLPRLLAKAIMLLSGKAPDFIEIEGKKFRVYENVTGIFTHNLFRLKLGQTPINTTL